MSGVRMLLLPEYTDGRGSLTVAEGGRHVPFQVKRAFWIADVPPGATRGGHAHARLEQVLVCMCGSLTVQAGDEVFRLWQHDRALYVPPFTWLEMRDWAPSTVLLVLCSEHYDAADYVYD